MNVIIPVAGVGSRLRPHTFTTPKALLHVAGRPILSHILDVILPINPDLITFVVGFRGDDIRSWVTDTYHFKSRFVEQDQLLGLGYAIDLALRDIPGGPLLVLLGDTIVECDIKAFLGAGKNVLGLRQVADPHRFGIAVVENGYIVELEEKPAQPKTNLAVIGLYYFDDAARLKKTLADHLSSGKTTRGEIQFTDALQMMIAGGEPFAPFEVSGWFDCGKKETVLETNRHLLDRMASAAPVDGSVLIPPVFIGEQAVVRNCVLGPYVSISGGAVVEAAVLRNSIVGPHARVSHVVLEDSLVGHHVNIKGAGKRLNVGDSSEIQIN